MQQEVKPIPQKTMKSHATKRSTLLGPDPGFLRQASGFLRILARTIRLPVERLCGQPLKTVLSGSERMYTKEAKECPEM